MGSLSTTCEISLSCSEEGSLSALVSQMRVLGGVIECNLSQNPHFPTTGVISQTGNAGCHNHSYEDLLWLLLQEIHYPDLQHALSTYGEKVLLKAPVDGFHEATNTVFQFHGCFWHGCSKCYRDRATKNTVNEETFDALYIKTIRRTQQLRNAGYHVIEK